MGCRQFYIPLALAGLIFLLGGWVIISKGQPIFTLMYFMFVLVGAGGLIVTANLAPISKDLKVDDNPVTLAGLTLPALTFAATIDRILNGFTRPFFGWISDHIGRENTMLVAFGIEGVGIYCLYLWGADPVWFVLLSGLVFFAWGEIYSLFPSTATDTFGSKFATTNAGLLYTAKGTAALLVPYASTHPEDDGQLGHGLHHRGGCQYSRRRAGHRRAQAVATQGRGGEPVAPAQCRGGAPVVAPFRRFPESRSRSMCGIGESGPSDGVARQSRRARESAPANEHERVLP